jgi:hypothetical protein
MVTIIKDFVKLCHEAMKKPSDNLSKFWSRTNEKFYEPHTKVEFLDKMQDWKHFFKVNDGGIPPIHIFVLHVFL